jgi:hypothetical protein
MRAMLISGEFCAMAFKGIMSENAISEECRSAALPRDRDKRPEWR